MSPPRVTGSAMHTAAMRARCLELRDDAVEKVGGRRPETRVDEDERCGDPRITAYSAIA
jgi:hypothetical protein